MENEIKEEINLLTKDGKLVKEGWARHPFWKYDRSLIKANKLRIKEWDYYEAVNLKEEFAIMVTFSDLGFASLYVIGFIDYKRKANVQVSAIKPLTLHKTGLKPSPYDDSEISYSNQNMSLAAVKRGNKRSLLFTAPKLKLPSGKIGLKADLTLIDNKENESVNIATSWKEDRTCFYYNSKINPLMVTGKIWLGNERLDVKENDMLANIDWGRGRWTRENTWYWASLSGFDNSNLFGINLGYGFSDRTPSSENAIIYNGKVHKLEEVKWTIPDDFTSSNWTFEDSSGRLKLVMEPYTLRKEKDNVLNIIKSDQNQVFGKFSGYFLLENQVKVEINNIFGFAEKVKNKW